MCLNLVYHISTKYLIASSEGSVPNRPNRVQLYFTAITQVNVRLFEIFSYPVIFSTGFGLWVKILALLIVVIVHCIANERH